LAKRRAEDCEPARADSSNRPAILFVQGDLKLLQRLHMERLVQALGQYRAHSGNGAENIGRFARTA
jgi:hypothetical protein